MNRELLPFERSFRSWVERSAMGWEHVEVQLPGQEETTRAYRFTPAEQAKGTVITIHGAGNDALFGWVGLFKHLLTSGREVLTFDLPGHGRRTRTKFTPDDAVATLEAALDRCAGPIACLPMHAIGVSLGGAVLLGALPRLQERLASAALIVAPLRIHLTLSAVLREVSPRNFGIVWREREHYGLTGLIPSFGPFKRDIYPLHLESPVPPGSFGYVEALNEDLAGMELEGAARAVTLPVLLVYGRRDRIVPVEQGERLAGLIRRSVLHRIARGSHLSTPLEPEVTALVLDWISRAS